MKRRHNLRKIVSKRCYSTEEIAELLNVHIQTVRSWRKQGLKPIEETSSPFLFLGSDIREFLSQELAKQRVKLAPGECYCLRCRKGVKPVNPSILDRNIGIGKDKQSVFEIGTCPECGLKLRRFSTLKKGVKPSKPEQKIEQPKQQIVPEKGQLSLFQFNGED